jgi:hypothetical protein
MRKIDTKYNEIEIDLDISTSALRSTLTKEQLCPKGIAQSRSSRPTIYSEADERNLLRYIRLNPKYTYKECKILVASGHVVCHSVCNPSLWKVLEIWNHVYKHPLILPLEG